MSAAGGAGLSPRKVNLAKKAAERKQSSGSSRATRYRGTVLLLLHQRWKELTSEEFPPSARNSAPWEEFGPQGGIPEGQMTAGGGVKGQQGRSPP